MTRTASISWKTRKAYIAWAKGPKRTVINLGEFATVAEAIEAAEASPGGMAEVETVHRPLATLVLNDNAYRLTDGELEAAPIFLDGRIDQEQWAVVLEEHDDSVEARVILSAQCE